jgi:nucleotide-binding universal stress UspA family protein
VPDAIADLGADVLVLGPPSGEPGATADLGSTTRAVLARSGIPAVVVPLDAPESESA